MEQKLNKADARILYELDRDCRTPLSEIGKTIRKTPQYVKYRVDRMKEEGIIKGVTIIPSLPVDSFEVAAFIRLQGADITQEKMLLDYLFKLPETYQLYYCDGAFSVFATLIVQDTKTLQELKKTLFAEFAGVEAVQFYVVTSAQLFNKKYLIEGATSEVVKLAKQTKELSAFEERVLQELSRSPFESLLDIAEQLKVSYDKIKYLFKKGKPYAGTRLLVSDTVAKKVILLLDVKNMSDEIMTYALLHPHIVQVDELLGQYTLAMYFEALPETELSRVIKEFLYRFKDAIREHQKLEILHSYKYRWLRNEERK